MALYNGTADDDQIYGNNSNDTLNGLAGNDTLDGGAGDDTYIFSKYTHNDVINESGSGNDQIVLSGLNRADVLLQKTDKNSSGSDGLNLMVTIIKTGENLIIKNQFDSDSEQWIERLQFADGTVLTRDQLNAETNKSVAGNNTMWGWEANDTFVFGRETGSDTIQEWGGVDDLLMLSNLNRADVILQKTNKYSGYGLDLQVTIKETRETLIVKNQFDSDSSQWVERLQFADGTVLTRDQLNTETNKSVAGNNKMWGWEANDTFVFALGAGTNTIRESGGVDDKVKFTNVKLSDITSMDRSGSDLIITYGKTDKLTVQNQFYSDSDYAIEQFQFAGGDTLTQFAIGSSADDNLVGGMKNDALNGLVGSDNMKGGAGNDLYFIDNIGDSITETANGGVDSVRSAISYKLGSFVENLTLTGANAINGTGNVLNNTLTGNQAANNLNGGNGKDVLIGGLANDNFILTETQAATDTVIINTGDSLLKSYDTVIGFAVTKGQGTTGVDQLDLAHNKIAANVATVNGVNVGHIRSHAINKGIITFDDAENYKTALNLTTNEFSAVQTYLQNNIKANATVAFTALGNTYVFQDDGATDTLVQLTGLTASNLTNTGLITNGVWLVWPLKGSGWNLWF